MMITGSRRKASQLPSTIAEGGGIVAARDQYQCQHQAINMKKMEEEEREIQKLDLTAVLNY